MKKLASFDSKIGGDGGLVGGAFGVEGDQLKAELTVTFPIEKLIHPLTKSVDGLLDKLEKAIPGDWDKPLIEKLKDDYKKELVKLLTQ